MCYDREKRDSDESRQYILETKFNNGLKLGTIVREMDDGGYETQDENYTYFWWDKIENNSNWKRIK